MRGRVIKAKEKSKKPVKKVTDNAERGDITKIKLVNKKHQWHDWVVPFMGIKWGATIVAVGWIFATQRDNDGLLVVAAILSVFTFLEWTAAAINEFKRS